MFRYLPLILKSSMRSKRRSILTVTSAAISLSLLGTLMAIYHAFYFGEAPPQQALRAIARNRVSPALTLPIYYGDKIKRVPGVVEAMPFQFFAGVYKEPKNIFARYAVQPEHLFAIHADYSIPEEQKVAFQKEKRGCVVGRGLAEKYGFKIGDRITLKGDIFPVTVDLQLVGIYDSLFHDDVLFFRLDYLFDLLPERRRNKVFAFHVLIDDPGSMERICKEIDELFRNSPARTRTEAERAFELGFLSMLGNVKGFLLSISVALSFMLLLVTANTMAMSVRERVREVGVLKTLGFTTPAILSMLLGEAAFLTAVGGLIGCGFTAVLVALVRKLPAIILPLSSLQLEPSVAVLLLAVAVVIGLASAIMPAWGAARIPILQALKFTD
ncbi:MAG TPA: FtsX-like permease family protein [Bryobacteraceae bacterium]|nr:FtsX-like permease family protein [Bryobacteraceae bacterium]